MYTCEALRSALGKQTRTRKSRHVESISLSALAESTWPDCVLCIHLLMCGQKNIQCLIVHKMAAWLASALLGLFVCLFVRSECSLIISLSLSITKTTMKMQKKSTSGVSYIKSCARGSQGKRCISEEMVVSRCQWLLQGQILPPIGHAILHIYIYSIYGHLLYFIYALHLLCEKKSRLNAARKGKRKKKNSGKISVQLQ